MNCFSEHRRHYQQQDPTATSVQLDNRLCEAWEKLDERTKAPYFQRANRATRDRPTQESTNAKQTKNFTYNGMLFW